MVWDEKASDAFVAELNALCDKYGVRLSISERLQVRPIGTNGQFRGSYRGRLAAGYFQPDGLCDIVEADE